MHFVGEVRAFAGNFAPSEWFLCNGQLLPIAPYTALFSLIGTTYGGNGVSTFALPDLRGRVPIHPGQGPGLADRLLGEAGGEETHPLTTAEIPAHTHTVSASSANGSSDGPEGRLLARSPAAIPQYAGVANANLAAAAVASSGGNQVHNNMQPYLTVTYIIAYQGVYPQRP